MLLKVSKPRNSQPQGGGFTGNPPSHARGVGTERNAKGVGGSSTLPHPSPRYRMRSGNYRVLFFILHNHLVIEVISIRRKKTGMDY